MFYNHKLLIHLWNHCGLFKYLIVPALRVNKVVYMEHKYRIRFFFFLPFFFIPEYDVKTKKQINQLENLININLLPV